MVKRKTIEIDFQSNDLLIALAQKRHMTKKDCIEYLIILATKYNLTDNDWQENLIKDQVATGIKEFKEKFDYKAHWKQSEARYKQLFNVKNLIFKEFLKSFPSKKELHEFTAQILNLKDGKDPLDKVMEMSTVLVDGKMRWVDVDDKGYPQLDEHDQRKGIVECNEGFHVIGNFCHNCKGWRTCQIRNSERQRRQLDVIPPGATQASIRRDYHDRSRY